MEEAHPEAAAILAQAGWTPHPEWGVYTRGPLVMGGVGGSFHVKDYTRIPPGHPQYGPDTPDTAEEAAAWLVARFPNPLATEATLELITLAEAPEAEETPQHESDGETGEASEGGLPHPEAEPSADASAPDDSLLGSGGISDDGAYDGGEADSLIESEPLDADFSEPQDLGAELLDEYEAELPALEGADLEEAEPEPAEDPPQGQDRVYGLDDLDRVRAVAIHRVRLYANGLMPPWYPDDDARLATLRNFAMGVSEKRWDDDAAKQTELNALETTVRRINEIKNARDAKAEFLENASREDVEAFVVEADWP